MKKTILSLALATFAVSALANYSLYKTEATNIYVNGSLTADISGSATTSFDQPKADDPKTLETKTETTDLDSVFGLNLGTGATSKVGRFSGGYYVEFSKTLLELNGKTRLPFEKLSKADISKAYGFLSDDVLGKLSYGKMGANSLIGDDINGTLDFDNQTSLFDSVKVSNPYTVAYQTPVHGGFQFNYSFTNNYDSGKYQRQNVWQFTYNYDSKNYGSFNASLGASYFKGYSDSNYAFKSLNLDTKANQFQLSVGSSNLVENLDVTFVYSIGIQKNYNDNQGTATLTGERSLARSFLLKTSYSLNQYFNPYAGFGYVQEYKVAKDSTTAKVFQGYVGVASTLFSYSSLELNAYAEVADKYVLNYVNDNGKSDKAMKKNVFSYAAGLSVGF